MGSMNVLRETIKSDGFFAIYRGYSVLLTTCIAVKYVRFGAYDFFQSKTGEKTPFNNFMCGMLAGATEATLVVTP